MQLNPFHKNFRRGAKDKNALRLLRKHNGDTIEIRYDSRVHDKLAQLCQKYSTDKGAIDKIVKHNYSDFYELIFSQKREYIQHVDVQVEDLLCYVNLHLSYKNI